MALVYLDGVFLDQDEARVDARDAGLLFGMGLFETFRARRGKVYLLKRHVARLRHGAEVIGISLPAALGDIEGIVQELTLRSSLDDARVRLTLTGGYERGRERLLVQARPADDYPPRVYEDGITAITASTRRNEYSPLSGVKSLNYLDNLLARRQARDAGADEALLLNTAGRLAEGSATNLFVLRGGELVTPPLSEGGLPGVTRGAVLELAGEAGYVTRELPLDPSALLTAGEAFMTNAIGGVLPLVAVDGVPVASGSPGEATRRIRRLYEAAAGA
jgi:branched-subunit amino acid aminotransferase/4-amino-4-deoxychorismate lyase